MSNVHDSLICAVLFFVAYPCLLLITIGLDVIFSTYILFFLDDQD
jgi:hypothetical protein